MRPPPDASWVQMETRRDVPGYGLILAPMVLCLMLAAVVVLVVS